MIWLLILFIDLRPTIGDVDVNRLFVQMSAKREANGTAADKENRVAVEHVRLMTNRDQWVLIVQLKLKIRILLIQSCVKK